MIDVMKIFEKQDEPVINIVIGKPEQISEIEAFAEGFYMNVVRTRPIGIKYDFLVVTCRVREWKRFAKCLKSVSKVGDGGVYSVV